MQCYFEIVRIIIKVDYQYYSRYHFKMVFSLLKTQNQAW